MSDPQFVDVSYRGLVVARKAKLVADGDGAFVELEAPLPVGTAVSVAQEGAEAKAARVVGVVEHEAAAKSPPGMRLAWAPPPGAVVEPAGAADTIANEAAPGEGNGNGAPDANEKKKRKKRK